jgi:hypothetical protein
MRQDLGEHEGTSVMATRNGRRRWNDLSDTGSASTPAARIVRRLFTAALLLVLVGILMSYWKREPLPATRIAAMRASGYRSLKVSPVPFLRADTELIATGWPEDTTLISARELQKLESKSDFASFRHDLQETIRNPSEKLVVYLKAHGVSAPGTEGHVEAMILCGNEYHPHKKGVGRIPVDDVLRAVSEINASLKLVILDCVHTVADFQLGMAGNVFSEKTAEHVAELPDDNVWVLLNAGSMQRSRPDYQSGHTWFAASIAEALAGRADAQEDGGNGNYRVELAEFYDYVLRHGSRDQQTPVLLRGGSGALQNTSEIPADAVLVAGIARVDDDSSTVDASENDETDDNAQDDEPEPQPRKTEGPSSSASNVAAEKNGSNATDTKATESSAPPNEPDAAASEALGSAGAETATSDDTASKPAADSEPQADTDSSKKPGSGELSASPSLETDPQQQLSVAASGDDSTGPLLSEEPPRDAPGYVDAGWRIRQDIFSSAPLTIDDSADLTLSSLAGLPHQLKLADARLLELDTRMYSGGQFEESSLDPRQRVEELQRLASNTHFLADDDLLKLDELKQNVKQAWQRASSDTAHQDDLDAVIEIWNTWLEMAYQLPWLVRWHDRASETCTSSHSSLERVADLIESLSALRKALLSMQRDEIVTLTRRQSELLQAREAVDDAIRASLTSDSPSEIEAVLQIPFLTRTQRADGIDRLKRLSGTPANERPPVAITPDLLPRASWQRERAFDRLKLHARLLWLVRESPQLAELTDLDHAETRGDGSQKLRDLADIVYDEYRTLAKGFQTNREPDTDRGAVKSFRASSSQSAPPEVFPERSLVQDRLTRFLTAVLLPVSDLDELQDSSSVAMNPSIPPLMLPCFLIPSRVRLTSTDSEIPLAKDKPASVELTLTRTGDVVNSTRQQVRMRIVPPDLVAVERTDKDGEPVAVQNQELIDVDFNEEGKASIPLIITATSFAEPNDPSRSVTITAELADSLTSIGKRTIVAHLPARDSVELQVQEIDELPPGIEARRRMLPLYANRTTNYRLSLVNQTLEPRKVRVQLYRVPRPADAHWAPGLLFADDPTLAIQPKLLPGIEESLARTRDVDQPVAETLTFDLPDDGDPIRIPFAPAAKSTSPPPAATTNAAAADPDTATVSVTHGLVAVISEMKEIASEKGEGETTPVPTGKEWIHWIELHALRPDQIFECSADWNGTEGRVTVDVGLRGPELPDMDEKPVRLTYHLMSPVAKQPFDTEGTTEVEERNYDDFDFHFPQLQPTGSPRHIQVDIDGYRRAFLLELECPEASTAQAVLVSTEQMPIIRFESASSPNSPREYRRHSSPAAGFRLFDVSSPDKPQQLAILPRPVFPGSDTKQLRLHLATDLPDTFGNRGRMNDAIIVHVDKREFGKFYRDRNVTVSLARAFENGILALATSVSDHQIEFEPNTKNGPLQFEAGLSVEPHDHASARDSVTVVLDDARPEIVLQLNPTEVIQGTDLAVAVNVKDPASGAPLEKIEFGFDENDDGLLTEGELLGRRIEWPGELSITMRTQDRKPGRHTLLARAFDAAGNISHEAAADFSVKLPPEPKPAKPATPPKTGDVRIQFTKGGKDVGGGTIKVRLDGQPGRTQNGVLTFTDVPLGVPLKLQILGATIKNNTLPDLEDSEVTFDATTDTAEKVITATFDLDTAAFTLE